MLAAASEQQHLEAFAKAMAAIAAVTGKPLLYGPNGRALAPTGGYTLRRDAAKRTGSLKNWRPQEVFSNQVEAHERAEIVKRSIDLANNDPHAAGIIDTYATTVIGAGLLPHPSPDPDTLNLDAETEAAAGTTPVTVYWSLTDRDGLNYINDRQDVDATAERANPMDFVLTGDDLQILPGETGQRYTDRRFALAATYNSNIGAGLNLTGACAFLVENLAAVS